MKTISSVLAAASLLQLAHGANLGDPAAELAIAKWVKGKPVDVTGDDKGIYVVEFWATWCPPCRTSIPHLTQVQKRFQDKNVVIIGISDEKEETVAPFVKEWAGKMDYRVAIDDDRKTSRKYMEAYGQNGIPHAFVVQNRKVIWHGHPMAGLDKALEEITSGRYDLAKAKAESRAEGLYDEFRQAAAEGDDAKADALATEFIAAAKGTSFAEREFDPAKEKREIRSQMLKREFQNAVFRNRDADAERVGEKLKALDPSADLDLLREEVAVNKLAQEFMQTITRGSDAEAATEKARALAPRLKAHPYLANNVAWEMLTGSAVKHRNVPIALQIAKQACDDTEWKSAMIVDTYARALFDSGKKDEAIRYQEKAVAAAGDDKAQYEQTLASYKEGKVPSTE